MLFKLSDLENKSRNFLSSSFAERKTKNLFKMIRRDFLKILSLFGITGTISYLLNTNQIQAGIQEIKGEVEINGNEFGIKYDFLWIPSCPLQNLQSDPRQGMDTIRCIH